jgi:hypothetical protein
MTLLLESKPNKGHCIKIAIALYRIFTEQLIGIHVANNLLIFMECKSCSPSTQSPLYSFGQVFFSSLLRNKSSVFVLLKMKQKSIIPIHHVSIVVPVESKERNGM